MDGRGRWRAPLVGEAVGPAQPKGDSVRLVVKDPNGFRKPLPLAILGRGTDGSYPVGTVIVP